jgi:hypothetical protein
MPMGNITHPLCAIEKQLIRDELYFPMLYREFTHNRFSGKEKES